MDAFLEKLYDYVLHQEGGSFVRLRFHFPETHQLLEIPLSPSLRCRFDIRLLREIEQSFQAVKKMNVVAKALASTGDTANFHHSGSQHSPL